MYTPDLALRTLADIMVSANVGAIHLRRVGEVLVARADMDDRILYPGAKGRVSDELLDELMFSVTDVEDAYIRAWQACEEGSAEWRKSEGLAALETALRRAAEYFLGVATQE
ncbi:hypothetical protein [Streptomyces xanthophaeus]|uniref:hypothetical protein n=1 Tax=Streptomyces xanthophaeus TaxID=67385 RepID=UPI0026489D0C|nr:hypothetical protein [Streptomyces xanthophaeus]WKD31716.1 hypothetical protein KO717_06960 [Streptomyces xanthophaeus]